MFILSLLLLDTLRVGSLLYNVGLRYICTFAIVLAQLSCLGFVLGPCFIMCCSLLYVVGLRDIYAFAIILLRTRELVVSL